MSRTVHVYPSRGGWAVKRQATAPSRIFATQKAAVKEAQTLAKTFSPSQVVVIGRDGMIHGATAYGFPKVLDPPTRSTHFKKIEKAVVKLALESIGSEDRA